MWRANRVGVCECVGVGDGDGDEEADDDEDADGEDLADFEGDGLADFVGNAGEPGFAWESVLAASRSWLIQSRSWLRNRFCRTGQLYVGARALGAAFAPGPGRRAGWNGIQTCTLVPTPGADLSIAVAPPCAAAMRLHDGQARGRCRGRRGPSVAAPVEAVERAGRRLRVHALKARVGHLEQGALVEPTAESRTATGDNSGAVCSRTLPEQVGEHLP